MASAPNMRVAPSVVPSTTPAAPAAEAGDFISRMLAGQPAPVATGTVTLTGVGLEQGLPTLIRVEDGPAGKSEEVDVAAPELAPRTLAAAPIDGLIPLVQAQGDYAVSVVVKTPKGNTPESAEPTETAPLVEAAIQAPAPIAVILPAPPLPTPIPAIVAARPLPTPAPVTVAAPQASTNAPVVAPAIVPPATPEKTVLPVATDTPAARKPIAAEAGLPSPSAEPAKGISSDSEPTPADGEAGPRFTTTVAPLAKEVPAPTLRPATTAQQEGPDTLQPAPTVQPTGDAPAPDEASAQIAAALRSAAASPDGEARTVQRQRVTLQASTRIVRGETARNAPAAAEPAPRAARPAERAPEPQTARLDARHEAPQAPAAEVQPSAPQASPVTPSRTFEIAAARIDPAEQAVDRALDLAKDSEWLDQLARDIAGAGERDGTLRFRLNPNTLGQMRIELSQTEQGTAVRMSVETEAARTILADAQSRLVTEARAQGVRIAETNVDLSGSDQHMSGDPRRQEEARQNPMIRTAPAASERETTARPKASRSDRYA